MFLSFSLSLSLILSLKLIDMFSGEDKKRKFIKTLYSIISASSYKKCWASLHHAKEYSVHKQIPHLNKETHTQANTLCK